MVCSKAVTLPKQHKTGALMLYMFSVANPATLSRSNTETASDIGIALCHMVYMVVHNRP